VVKRICSLSWLPDFNSGIRWLHVLRSHSVTSCGFAMVAPCNPGITMEVLCLQVAVQSRLCLPCMLKALVEADVIQLPKTGCVCDGACAPVAVCLR
jgi:hypothetical protein